MEVHKMLHQYFFPEIEEWTGYQYLFKIIAAASSSRTRSEAFGSYGELLISRYKVTALQDE